MAHAIVATIAIGLSLYLGLFQRRDRVALFHVWLLWSVLASAGAFNLLSIRWPVAVLAGVVGLYWRVTTPSTRTGWDTLLPLGLAALAMVSCAYTLTLEYTFLRAGGLLLIVMFTVMGGAALFSDPGQRKALFESLAIGMLTPALYILLGASPDQWAFSAETRLAAGTVRATGAASFALSAMIFLAYPALRGRGTAKHLSRLMWLVFLLAIVATRTRGVLAAAALILPLQYLAFKGRRGLVPLLAATIALGALTPLLVNATGGTRAVLEYLRLDDPAEVFHTRVDDRWDIVVPKALERPLLGRGFGTARFFFDDDDFVETAVRGGEDSARVAHNQYLTVFYELGILGLAVFLATLLYFGSQGISAWLAYAPTEQRARLTCVLAFFAQGVIDMMFHDGRLTVGNGSAYWFWFAAMFLATARRAPIEMPVVVTSRQGTVESFQPS